MAKKDLTIRQKKFVDEYLKTGNATQSAIKAGYAKTAAGATAQKTLASPRVKEYMDKRLKRIDDKSIADMKEVRQRLTAHARGEVVEESVVTVKKPELMEVPTKDGGTREQLVYVEYAQKVKSHLRASDQLKALELLGKTGAIFTVKTDVNASIDPVKIIDDIPAPENGKGDNDNG